MAAPVWGEEITASEGAARRLSKPPPQSPRPAAAKKEPARKAAPDAQDPRQEPRKTGQSARQPARGDAGKVPNASDGRDESESQKAEANAVPEARSIVPIAPAPFAPAAAPTPAAPPERLVVPVDKTATPPAATDAPGEEPAAAADETAATAENLAATAAKLAATAAKLAATAAKLAATAARASAADTRPPARNESYAAVPAAKGRTAPMAAPPAPEPVPPPKTAPAAPENPATVTLDEAVFDQIRQEIKGRLPSFQACASAARRRGSADVTRVQATWTIAADGAIKEMKVEGVPDPQLATCIARMGSRPFAVQPGTELTIPTPIVFVQ